MIICRLTIGCHMITDAGFIMPPYIIIQQNPPNTQRERRVSCSPRIFELLKTSPAENPTSPIENICHGVHGPWPNTIFDTSIVTAPVINPVSQPNATPLMITIAITGLKFGIIKNAVLPTAASAHKTATVTRSLADTFRVSNATPNGIIISIKTKSEIK